ncbi:transcriptional regulator [Bacillus sp. SA1-12]|uniref:Nif3-like dinuclear metal center hexameric protein n=1 Tax=Bacillus sp. SA1-12 TaxID=1455638 RepID=UPI000626C833|nr:Nif3-like dinuclear metal center hexameric protein [Bacillus sp. SA1-12]KKI91546.1 transcriptional regulator [Bacillus sp. SA1-12]
MTIKIQDVLDKLMEPVNKLETTVDKLLFGDPSTEVKGIIVTFVASHDVLQHAIDLGANLIISHEGIFYSHQENGEHLKEDPVYMEKRRFIEQSGVAIYRFHDYVHKYQPDGIMEGLIQELDWNASIEKHHPTSAILTIPSMTVKEIAEYIKEKLGISFVRVIGDLSLRCTRIGLLAGYRGGGDLTIPLIQQENLDLILYGEGPEWETPEYIRDAHEQNRKKAAILIGHAASEEPGMKHLAEGMKSLFPSIPVHFISEKNPIQFL